MQPSRRDYESLAGEVKQAQAGDLAAFRELVVRFQDMAVGYAFSLLGDYHLVDVETNELRPVTINESHLKRYKALFQGYCDDLDRYCIQREIGLVRTTTQSPFEELILRIFRMGGFVS